MAELQSQLKKLIGKAMTRLRKNPVAGWSAPIFHAHAAGLGSRYAELYREAKIQEAVYAFVTQQFEMARIQEAKELPIVRVMDAGVASEKRSSPIRSLIVVGTVFGAFLLACFWWWANTIGSGSPSTISLRFAGGPMLQENSAPFWGSLGSFGAKHR